ncbi:uncharacterized protein LOC129616647 isoform X3 [Condylostylus longicornis]|uniref:uncharacterized protein LOC129616647 isoform X3 n=1 Tax=Condylostylus longicornis TaxID=2530218 RepID=UPI00244DBECA|nr:uncharacterized protein LOC129616647 isoform X3 [Condylostylus longicornis]
MFFIFPQRCEISKLASTYSINSPREWDICSHWNGRRHFLELGERGELHARNVSASNYMSTFYTSSIANINNRSILSEPWYQCNLELVTCSECVIRITFTYSNFSKTCQPVVSSNDGTLHNKCFCEHITFSEPPYDVAISGKKFCGEDKVFRSTTRSVLLQFFFQATYIHIFSLQYFSERNVNVISGSPRIQNVQKNSTKSRNCVITTPYFPVPYPRDYGVEHILTCETEDCHVKLEFSDFQLGMISTMMVFDSNGQMLDSYNGEIFRPPVIMSSGKSLLLQFRGNGVTGVGFRAAISFISDIEYNDKLILPNTDCGGMVEGLGGAITMMNMIENETEIKYYDCIWIIKPANNYMMMKTHISVRVDTFIGMESNSVVELRQGTISTALLIESVNWPSSKISEKTHITPILSGFYIHLKGIFGKKSRLAIVYSVFNYMNCYIGSEFLCQNNHCLSIRLHCDGFDQCGDGSDEPETCGNQISNVQSDQREWYTSKPNYYFPKIEQYPDLKTATGIFVISTLGILVLLSGWMMILYRMGIRARNQRELQNQLQTISELLDRDRQEDQTDNPPDYEAPPEYDEVVKFKTGTEGTSKQRGRRNKRKQRHSKDQKNQLSRMKDKELSHTNDSAKTDEVSNILSDHMQSLSNIVVNSTATCENSKTIASKTEVDSTSCVLPTRHPKKTTKTSSNDQSTSINVFSAYSSDASTPFEESSSPFGDDSLNISLTLTMSNTKILRASKNHESLYSEKNNLKKAWVIFDNGHVQTIQSKRMRLRHTLSSPETFLHHLQSSDDTNYANIYNERNSYLSNATTFGSDLSSDHGTLNNELYDNSLRKEESNRVSNAMNFFKAIQTKSKILSTQNSENYPGSSLTMPSQVTLNYSNYSDVESDADPDISGFDNVYLFGNSKRDVQRSKQKKRGDRRSNSFTNYGRRHSAGDRESLKRCSSADLLMNMVTLSLT